MTRAVTIDGWKAELIDQANRASFYGINGGDARCFTGSRIAAQAVREALTGEDYNSFCLIGATTEYLGRDGYKAVITFKVD